MLNTVRNALNRIGVGTVTFDISEGQLILKGGVTESELKEYKALIKTFTQIQGIRGVRDLTRIIPKEKAIVDISSRYQVSGSTQLGDKFNVLIKGRLLKVGDKIDGMEILNITPETVFLEKGNVKYRIDY